ncbi:MAG TPA: hypothetical protein VJ201_04785 [Candidatus Babeliales bacterium]|nr:hypothetical protein [Candidatus Babeliales bacterium]
MFNMIKNKLDAYKNIIIAMTLLCTMNILPRQTKSLAQQSKEEAQREGIQKVNLMESERSNASDLYTQSQAHEHIPKMRELIQKHYEDKQYAEHNRAIGHTYHFNHGVIPHFNIISRMITKEAQLKDTHYVFYHATATMSTIVSDLFTQLYFHFNPATRDTADASTFRFLRFQGQSKNVPVQQFLEEEMRIHGLVDDKTKELAGVLLSVNLSLFGSVGSGSESTWLRFLDNRRSAEGWLQGELEAIMDNFGLTKKYIKDIINLDKFFAVTPEAALVQIFIPKSIVDSIVYLAWIRGLPASSPIMEWIKAYQSSPAIAKEHRGDLFRIQESREKLMEIFTKEQEKNPIFKKFLEDLKTGTFSTYAYLKAYRNNPSETPNLNDTQGRILFTKEGLLNPASGIKFYYYFSTPREQVEKYTKALNALVEKIIREPKISATAPKKPTPAIDEKKQTKPAPKPIPQKPKAK